MSTPRRPTTTAICAPAWCAQRWSCSRRAARPRSRCAPSRAAPACRRPPPTGTTPTARRSSQRSPPSATRSSPSGWPAAHPSPSTPSSSPRRDRLRPVRARAARPVPNHVRRACDRDNDERVAATAAVSAYVRSIVERTFPQADAEALATAIWALVHGLAFLYLDGKLDAPTPSAVADRISAAIRALLTATTRAASA